MQQQNSVVFGEEREDHPFKSYFEPGEVILWVGRPDKADFARRSWRSCYIAVGLLCLFLISVVGCDICFPSPSSDFSLATFGILVPLTIWMFVSFARSNYESAPWYALTNRRLFAATPDEGSPVIHKTELGNIKDVFVLKCENDVGTVRCSCHAAIASLWSKMLNIENTQHPQRIAEMITEAKCRIAARV